MIRLNSPNYKRNCSNLGDFEAFANKMRKAAQGEFKKEFEKFLQQLGADLLYQVADQIIEHNAMNSRLLLNSFKMGTKEHDEYGTWELQEGGLTLTVGTNVPYAKFVNDGFWTSNESTPGTFIANSGRLKGHRVRFVPGYWVGDNFVHDPNSGGGMMLGEQWVEAKPFWDDAINAFERLFPGELERKLQTWLDKYFGVG